MLQFVFPFPSEFTRISSPYGPRPALHDFHFGCDYPMPVGTPIYAPCSGLMFRAGYIDPTSNNVMYMAVKVFDDRSQTVWFFHISKCVVSEGEFVKPGQLIGYSGNTGRSTGPHTHVEIRQNYPNQGWKTVEPSQYFIKAIFVPQIISHPISMIPSETPVGTTSNTVVPVISAPALDFTQSSTPYTQAGKDIASMFGYATTTGVISGYLMQILMFYRPSLAPIIGAVFGLTVIGVNALIFAVKKFYQTEFQKQ